MTQVIAFDVNETLLDLRALDEPFERHLGSASLRAPWFGQMLQLSFVGGLTDSYVDFSAAQRAALHMVAERAGIQVSDAGAEAILDRMGDLPVHPEVPAALERLHATGVPLVALVNSLEAVAELQLLNAGIRGFFDRVISAHTSGHLKPAPQPYHAVAGAFWVPIREVRLVAAHSWDVSGALAAGCRAAFIQRPGMVQSPLGPQADIVATDIESAVDQIIEKDLNASSDVDAEPTIHLPATKGRNAHAN